MFLCVYPSNVAPTYKSKNPRVMWFDKCVVPCLCLYFGQINSLEFACLHHEISAFHPDFVHVIILVAMYRWFMTCCCSDL